MKQSLSNVVLDNMGKAATPQGNVSTKWGTVHKFTNILWGEV